MLEDLIDDLRLAGGLSAALRAVASVRNVETAREAGYISVRPHDRHIAAYFNKNFLDVAVTPDRASAVAARFVNASVVPKTTSTSYVRIPAGTGSTEDLVAVVVDALDWREHGKRWSGEWSSQAAFEPAGEICATCFTLVTPSGSCACE